MQDEQKLPPEEEAEFLRLSVPSKKNRGEIKTDRSSIIDNAGEVGEVGELSAEALRETAKHISNKTRDLIEELNMEVQELTSALEEFQAKISQEADNKAARIEGFFQRKKTILEYIEGAKMDRGTAKG